MTKKMIYIIGSAIIGIVSMLVVMLSLIGTGAIDATQTKLVYKSASAEGVYDGSALVKNQWELVDGQLKEGHTAKVSVTGSQTDVGVSDNHISVTVIDEDGADVTEYYTIEYQPGKLKVTPHYLEITADSLEKTYDGQSLKCETYKITDGSVVEGHILKATFTGSQLTVGTSVNKVSVTLTDGNGKDVSGNYTVKCNDGTLKVVKRPITVTSASVERVYDGQPISCDDYSLTNGELVTGHTMRFDNPSVIYNTGEADNSFSVAIYDANNTDVTSNYDVTRLFGKLKMLKIPLTVETAGAVKLYDGTPLINNTWRFISGDVLEGHTVVADFTGGITACGKVDNTAIFSVLDENGRNVTQNYGIEIVAGKLEVTKRGFVITSGSASKEYDGTPLTNTDITVLDGTVAEGHTITLTSTASLTNAGEIDNTFLTVIRDENGIDVTANYELTVSYGKLTVTKRRMIISSGTSSKEFDGTPLTNTATEVMSGEVAEGQTLTLVTTGTITNVGSVDNTFTAYISDGNGTDVTSNYEIEMSVGTLTITPTRIHISTASAIKEYDGTPLTAPIYEIISDTGIQSTHSIQSAVMSSSITNAGRVTNSFAEFIIVDENGTDVTSNYEITTSYGELIVQPREIVIRTGSASKDYDGEPLSCDEWEIVSITGVLDGHTIEVAVSGMIIESGQIDNVIAETIITDRDGTEVTRNYSIVEQLGKLTVKGEPVTGGSDANNSNRGEAGEGALDSSGNIAGGENEDVLMLEVKASTDGLIYLKLSSLGDYNGMRWEPAPSYDRLIADTYSLNYLSGIAMAGSGINGSNVEIKSYTSDYVLPSYMSLGSYNYTVQTSDTVYEGQGDNYSMCYYSYTGTGTELKGNLGSYSSDEALYRDHVYSTYLEIDSETRAYIDNVIQEQGISASDPDVMIRHLIQRKTRSLPFLKHIRKEFVSIMPLQACLCTELSVFLQDIQWDTVWMQKQESG